LLGVVGVGFGCTQSDEDEAAAPVVDIDSLPSGTIITWVGDGTQGDDGDGNDRLESWLNQPMEMGFGPDNLAYIVDWNNHRIRRVKADGTLETLIGTALPGDWPCQEPADPANCEVPLTGTMTGTELSLNHPMDLVFPSDEQFYLIAWHNHKVEEYTQSSGTVRLISGQQSPGFTGDAGAAASAKLNFPSSGVVDAAGNILLSDERNNRVRRIANDATRTITTVAGASSPAGTAGFGGEGAAATTALFALTAYNEAGGADNPPPGGGLVMDSNGNLYVADTFNNCIRKITPGDDGIIGSGDTAQEVVTTIAGSCGQTTGGYSGDGGAAATATLNLPFDLEFGPDGRLYVSDTENHVVRAINLTSGVIETVAGTGTAGFSGDGGPATEAKLNSPYGIAFDSGGNLYIADTLNNRIRVVAD
jgi:sugar lactone lactonase YvrE